MVITKSIIKTMLVPAIIGLFISIIEKYGFSTYTNKDDMINA
ncbi:hypothetical protein AKUA1805_TOXIN100180 (plasmid) [Apilactobacillus kunkeei]|nr:hypothetical protein AKUA1805_TOXIN100180 [Apilactobacillus kunkeei]